MLHVKQDVEAQDLVLEGPGEGVWRLRGSRDTLHVPSSHGSDLHA